MGSGANDQAKTLQPVATMVVYMLHCIQDDHMFLWANSFNRPTMKFFNSLLRFPLIHPQLQVSCTFMEIGLVHR